MTTKAVISSSRKTFTKPDSMRGLLYFIKHSDWDDEILAQEEWLDKMCISVIMIASLYLIPSALVMLFL
jgi:hypothetical protein